MYIIPRIRSFWFYSCMRDWDLGVGWDRTPSGRFPSRLTPQHPRMVCAMWHFSFGELEFGRLRRLEIKKGLRGQSRKAHSEVPTVGKVVNHQVGQHRQPARTRGWASPPKTLSGFRSLGRRYALHRTSGEKNVSRN